MSENRKKNRITRILALLAALVMGACLAGCGSTSSETTAESQTTSAETTTETSAETTTEETTASYPKDVITFALFGVDTVGYTAVDQGRSDIIKIVQIDPEAETIKFIGILRDSKVPIEGYEAQKINAAFQLGGADLALQTINENFGLNIDKYVMINFSGMVQLVDDIGGVEVEITEEEAAAINQQDGDYVGDGRQVYSVTATAGTMTLDGSQALAFSRTRKIDSDYFRSARQNKVLKAIIAKLKSMPVTSYPEIIDDFFNVVETNFTLDEVNLWTLMGIGDYDFSCYIVPDETYETDLVGGVDETGSWVWQYDLAAAGERINSILDGTFVAADTQNEYGENGTVHDSVEYCGTPLQPIE